jgi:hypothetical protein
MSENRERFAAELGDCGCCEGLDVSSPILIHNRPGLDAAAYRVGTHALFKESLLAALSSSRHPALADLKTRDDDDFSVALVDAFSCMADVLTFYQERFANEAWLRTADERLSLRELARLIGYQLAPGVAADAMLAFTLEEAPGAPADEVGRTAIATGTAVQSTPGPDEQPQIYETVEEIEGRVAWNAIRPPQSRRHPLTGDTNPLLFDGLATRLKPGDAVLYTKDGGGFAFSIVSEVEPRPELELTEVTVSYITNKKRGAMPPVQAADPDLGPLAPGYVGETWTAADLAAEAEVEGFDVDELLQTFTDNPKPAPRVIVFRTRAAVFGHNAPKWNVLPLPLKVQEKKYDVASDGTVTLVDTIPASFTQSTWIDGKTLAELDTDNSGRVFLDTTYPSIGKDSTVVLRQADRWAVYQVTNVAEVSHTDFNISARVTRLFLDDDQKLNKFKARKTTVFGGSDVLPLARLPITTDFEADGDGWLDLDGWVPGLEVGQNVILTGRAVGATEEPVSEAAVLEQVEYDLEFEGGTSIMVAPAIRHGYLRGRVALNANVAAATHGMTVEEILGSGDARVPYQSFVLAQPPLTFVSAASPSGRETTLKIRVNDVLWHEVDSFFERGPEERIFVTRQNDEGKTIVRFGDGVTGARLPSGVNNVRAAYRRGIGLDGRVDAGRLDVLMSRPLGLKEVVNPVPAEGGEDAETRDQARENAPLTVLTLGRAVSLQDYEDFARTFAGVAKALATWTWTGRRRSVFLTVAAAGGAQVPEGGFLHTTLTESLTAAGDPNVPLTIASYRKALFRLDADVIVHPDHLKDKVMEAVETTLRETFSFEARSFGQPVVLSEVVAAMQRVEGVVAVDLNKLYRTDVGEDLNFLLPSDRPLAGERGAVEAAEILFLDPAPLDDLRPAS